jgi:hypothetical protein
LTGQTSTIRRLRATPTRYCFVWSIYTSVNQRRGWACQVLAVRKFTSNPGKHGKQEFGQTAKRRNVLAPCFAHTYQPPRPRSFVGKLVTRQMLLPLLEPLPHVGSGTTPGASTTSTVHPSRCRCIRPGIATFFDSFRRWIFETEPVTIFFNRVCDKLCIDLLLVASQTASHLPIPPCPMFPTGMLHMPFVRCKFVRCILSSWRGSRPTKMQ